ncbi:MAG: hypothetical protein WBB39_05180 [Candidatus Saccharimonadales bacterium]
MISKLARSIRTIAVIPAIVLGLTLMAPVAVFAAGFDQGIQDGANSAQGKDQPADLFGEEGIFKTVTNILLFIVGAIAVIMLIVGGIQYVTSGGDQSRVTSAKNTILYAIVGIVVAVLAYAAVNFVTTSLTAQ